MEIEVEKFKKLILDMYRGFPNWKYFGMVEQTIKDKKDIDQLVKSGILVRIKSKQSNPQIRTLFGLGPNGLLLVNSWKMEDLTKKLLWLTAVMIVLVLLQIVYPIISTIRLF